MKQSFIADTIYIFTSAVLITTCQGFDIVHYSNSQQLPVQRRTLLIQRHRRYSKDAITTIKRDHDDNNNNNNSFSSTRRISSFMRLYAKSPNTNPSALDIPPSNEFSRTYQADRILKTVRKSTTGVSSQSYYPVTIEANPIECMALAHRFDLSAISYLNATLQLRPTSSNTGNSNSIEVEGKCQSMVTQRCVRTNEDFEVTIEFPIYCIVRPVIPSSTNSGSSSGLSSSQQQQQLDDIIDDESTMGSYQEDRNGALSAQHQQLSRKSNKNKKSYRIPDRNLDEMDVMELQRLLQADMNMEDDTLMEDEAIYTNNKNNSMMMIDVGELVAQLFWFKLDPYPKKPGTNPIQRSITG